MKYVMFLTDTGRKFAVLFDEKIIHCNMSLVVEEALHEDTGEDCEPVNAGFVSFKNGVKVYGRSETLNLDHNPIDAIRIEFGSAIEYVPDDMLPGLASSVAPNKNPTKRK